MRKSARFVLMISLLASFAAAADVYRWTDAQGVIHYTDSPPAKDAKPASLPPLQTYRPSAPTDAGSGRKDTSAAAADDGAPPPPTGIRIVSPQAEETVRDPEGKISIVVDTALQPGQGIVYLLDGKAQNSEATPSTGYLVTGAERGEHSVSAKVVGADGQEVARSAAVTVFMMPSVIRKR